MLNFYIIIHSFIQLNSSSKMHRLREEALWIRNKIFSDGRYTFINVNVIEKQTIPLILFPCT